MPAATSGMLKWPVPSVITSFSVSPELEIPTIAGNAGRPSAPTTLPASVEAFSDLPGSSMRMPSTTSPSATVTVTLAFWCSSAAARSV
ncbi:MAG: hypothetical protein U0166_03540 [Acidobacteriota bacterium]